MDAQTTGRITLISLGLALVAGVAGLVPGADWAKLWPVVPIVVGATLLR